MTKNDSEKKREKWMVSVSEIYGHNMISGRQNRNRNEAASGVLVAAGAGYKYNYENVMIKICQWLKEVPV